MTGLLTLQTRAMTLTDAGARLCIQGKKKDNVNFSMHYFSWQTGYT